jgi:HEAT repeat protein
LPCIVEACLDSDAEVADTAQHALGHMGDASVLPTLVGLIERGRLARTSGAVGSLILLGERFHDEVIHAVEPLLVLSEAGPRAAGATVVAGVAHKEDQQLMERLAGDHDPQVRAVAIQALGRIGGGEIIDRLRLHLADESAEVRLAAARALGNRADENAIIALRVALGDSDSNVVAQALTGLGQAGSTDAGGVVFPYVEHPDPVVALAAVKALNQLGWGEDQERLRRASRHADSEVVKEVLAGCGDWPQEAARAVLSEALTHKRWDVRMAVVKKIGAMRDSAGLQLLAERLLSEEDPIVREAAEQILRIDGEGMK